MNDCPAEAVWQRLLADDVTPPERPALETHLSRCAACQAALERLTSDPDAARWRELHEAGAGTPMPLGSIRLDRTAGRGPPSPDAPTLAVRGRPREAGRPDVPGYELHEELGRGGMGVVFKATQVALRRPVAIKTLLGGAAGGDTLARMRSEAEAVARLRHPHIVGIHEVGECRDGSPFLCLEYLPGGTLSAYLGGSPMPARNAATLVETLSRAIEAAHRAGVVHRDLKPGNVLLDDDGTPKVTDFGLAKLFDAAATQSMDGTVAGTPSYMAPEQARGVSGAAKPPVDIYALGAILYECLTGRPPFRAESAYETVLQVVHRDPVPPRQLQPHVPRDLETICLKCLRKEPAQRYATAAALADDLERFREGRPVLARPTGFIESAWKLAKRHPAVAGLLVAAQVALVATVAGVTHYNARLREAKRRADVNAATAVESLRRMSTDVQEEMRDIPKLRPLQDLLLHVALDGLNKVVAGADDDTPDVLKVPAVLQIADIHMAQARTAEGEAAYRRCADDGVALIAAGKATADVRAATVTALHKLGTIRLKADDRSAARGLMGDAVAQAEAWCAEAPTEPRARVARLEAINHAGWAALWVNDLQSAAASYARSKALADEFLADHPDHPEGLYNLNTSFAELATLAQERGDFAEARRLQTEGLAISRRVAALRPRNDRYRRGVMVNQFNLAMICRELGDLTAARENLTGALATADARVAADPENVEHELDVVEALRGLGRQEWDAGRLPQFGAAYRRAVTILERLDAAGQLAAQPGYRVEKLPAMRERLEVADRLPAVLADEAALWADRRWFTYSLAVAKVETLVREGRQADAAVTAEALAKSPPGKPDAATYYRYARACAAVAAMLRPNSGATPPAVELVVEAGVTGLGRAIDLGCKDVTVGVLQQSGELAPLRSHAGFAALPERLRRRAAGE